MITICYPFVGDSIGGSHISTITLIKSLQETRPDLTIKVLVFSANSEFREFLSNENITFDSLNLKLRASSKLGIVIDLARSFFRLSKYLYKEKIDIAHTNDLRINLIFLVVCKFFNIRHLWHQRTSMPKSYLGQRIFLLCDKFVTVSNYISGQILVNSVEKKITRVYNPVDSHLSSKEDLDKRIKLFSTKSLIIGYLANTTSQKNPQIFIDIAKIANTQKENDLEFVMIGKVNDEFIHQIELEKKNGKLSKSFKVLGFRKDIDDCLSKIDFLVVPAQGDGFGRTIVESMRAGVIVLALDSGGHSEIIQNRIDGILIKKLNAQDFMTSLNEICSDQSLYKSMLLNAHEKSRLHYTARQHAQEISLIYKNMMKAKN